jgi:hypothetical protein
MVGLLALALVAQLVYQAGCSIGEYLPLNVKAQCSTKLSQPLFSRQRQARWKPDAALEATVS